MKRSDITSSRLVIKYVDPLDLQPNYYNPNNHSNYSFDLLLSSLRRWGFTQPIVIQEETNIIIDGEHRWGAACILGFDLVPVCAISIDSDDMKLATIIHNRGRGKENNELVEEIYRKLGERGKDIRRELLMDREVPSDSDPA